MPFWVLFENRRSFEQRFSPSEEYILFKRILEKCQDLGFVEREYVTVITEDLKTEIISGTNASSRRRLQMCKFTRMWVSRFVKRHDDELSNHVSLPVDYGRVASFNAFNVGQFFAQVKLLYETLRIVAGNQICNLDETGFTPGRDLCGSHNHRVITIAGNEL